MWTENPLVRDAGAAVLTGLAAAVVLRLWEEVASRALLEQVMLHAFPLLLPPRTTTTRLFMSEIDLCLSHDRISSVLCNLLSTACASNRFELWTCGSNSFEAAQSEPRTHTTQPPNSTTASLLVYVLNHENSKTYTQLITVF
jgi:hypothetical protein